MSHPGRVSHSVPDHHMRRSGMGSHCRCGCQIDSASRWTRGPALTDDVSTLDVSTQANGQNPEGLFINGAQSWTQKEGSIRFGFDFIERSPFFRTTKPLETRLKALMNAYVTQFLLGTLILKEENGSVCVWVAVLTQCWERWK